MAVRLAASQGTQNGATAGGHAYRDGPFIITFREGLNGRQPTSADITGVLVNPAHSELVAPLQQMFPNITVRDYNGVADVVAASRNTNRPTDQGNTRIKNVNESRGPAPISKRDDLVGAIMRVTGGKGIAANQAQTIVGDKANAATKVRGLFTNDGTADLGDVAMLLRDEEGYSVKDGEHLSELIREQASGNPVHSMERTEREASANAEKEYKASVNQKAEELGLKKVGGKRTLQMVEADISAKEKEIADLEAREERAAIQASVIAEDIYQEGSELTETDLMQWLGDQVDYSQDEINEANSRASERESRRAEKNAADDSQEQAQSRNSEGAGTGRTEAGARSTEGEQLTPSDTADEDIIRRAKALGMKTAGVSNERLTKQVEEAEARNAFDLTKQTNDQAAAEFKRQQEEANKQDDEPVSPTVKADQVDLFNTQDSLFNSNRDDGVKYSKALESEASKWANVVTDFFDGKIARGETPVVLSSAPASLQALGLPNYEIRISLAHGVDDALYNHGVKPSQLKAIPNKIADPLAVFINKGSDGKYSINILTDMFVNGKQLAIAIQPSKYGVTSAPVHFVATITPRENGVFAKMAENGQLVYAGENMPVDIKNGLAIAQKKYGQTSIDLKALIASKFVSTARTSKLVYKSDLVKLIEDGKALYSFAGQAAVTADQYSLETAQKRLKNKDSAETVRRETGWFIGVDGKWRFEISDDEAKLKNPPAYQSFENYFSQREKEVYGEDFFPSSLSAKDHEKYDAFRDEIEDEYNKLNGARRLSSSGENSKPAAKALSSQQAEQRILSLLGDKLGQVLLDSGIITFTNKGNAYQGATYTNGKIALNLDNLTADNFDGVLQHEGLHSTLREYIGEETYTKLMKQLDTLLKMGKGSKWVDAAHAAVPKETAPENVTEEIAAYSVEQYVNGGKLPGVLQRWAKEFLSTLRTAIIKSLPNGKLKTWAISNITAQDLSKLAIAGLKAKAAGQLQAQGREAMAFSSPIKIEDLHGKFWSSIKAGKNSFTKDEIYGAYASGRRGTNRKGELGAGSGKSLSSPEAARITAEWDENIGGFQGYVTTATWLKDEDGLDAFYVSVIPKELWGKTNPLNGTSLDNTSITQYSFSEMPDGTYDLHINDVAKGSDVERLLKQNNRLEVNKENPAYQHAVLDNRYTESRALMQEAIRRLALATNLVPTITQTERDTGARAGTKELRVYPSDTVSTKFSKINQTATEAFKKWFGNSKVVDAEGKPLVVYHGTMVAETAGRFTERTKDMGNITAFDRMYTSRFRGNSIDTVGSWFSDNSGNGGAEMYSGNYEGSAIYPVYLSIQTPQVTTFHLMLRRARLLANGKDDGRMIGEAEVNAYRKWLKEMGKDGIKIEHDEGASNQSTEFKNQSAWIALEPEQIKSATGNNGDFDGSNPDIRYSKAAQIIGDSGRPYDQTQRDFFKNVGRDINPQTRIEKAADYLRNDFWKKMAIGIVDQFRGLRDLNDNGQAYMLARLSKGTAGAFDALLHHGKLSLKDGVYDADTSGGFVERLGKPLNGELDDVLWWIAANRAEGLAAQGKENLFTPQDIAAGKSLATGKTNFDYTMQTGPLKGKTTRDRAAIYADANRVFNEFQKNTLDMAEQSGLIDGASRKYWESEFYVPFYRVSEEDGEFIGSKMGNALVRQQAFKKLKGGTDKLNSDLLSNTLLNWSHLIEASAKNRAAKATLTAAEKVGAAHKASYGEKNPVWYMGEITKTIPKGQQYTEGGIDKVSDGAAQITYVGKVEYVVDDPFVMTAITSLEYAGMRNGIMDVLTKFKHFLTVGVTASPAFKVRNLIRDSIQAIGTSDLGYNPIKNVVEGFKQTNRDSQEYVSALASGGLIRFGTMLEGSESSRVRQLINSGVKDSTILNTDKKWKAFYDQYLDPAISAYNELGNRSEEITRAALFNQLIKNGKSHAEAALLARDLMDFSMQGSFNTIRFLTQVVPFANARLQGLYKLSRAAKDDPRKMAIVTGAVALASIALMMANGDDEDWKRREDFDRDGNWWFKFGGIEWRIPKPFEIGAVASLAERSVELLTNDEMTGERFRKIVSDLVMNNLSMNPIPQAIKPIVDLYANKDSFTGRPIETMGMQRLEKTERFNSNTSMVARGLSNATIGALSPVQYDHVARAYFGWLGSFVVGGADMAVRATSDEPTQPARDYFKFASQGILKEVGTGGSRYLTMVYEQAAELEQAHATYRQMLKDGKIEAAKEYADDNADKLNRYRSVENVKRAESKLNEQIRMIERGSMDADQKKVAIERIQKQKEIIAKRIAPGLQ